MPALVKKPGSPHTEGNGEALMIVTDGASMGHVTTDGVCFAPAPMQAGLRAVMPLSALTCWRALCLGCIPLFNPRFVDR